MPGYAFVPLLSSHACAIPGILATRLIPDRHDRFATILVAPFMSCSARLPVYVLLTNFLFADQPLFAGIAFAACYLLGAIAAMASAFLVRRTLLPGKSRPMVLELPTYKWPSLRVAFANAFEQGWSFLRTVGTVILAICFVMWWLSAYPKVEPPAAALALSAQAAALAPVSPEGRRAARRRGGRTDALASAGGELRRPAGSDRRTALRAARLRLATDDGRAHRRSRRARSSSRLSPCWSARRTKAMPAILQRIHAAKRDDGSRLLTPATAVSLLVFFVLAMQCLATVVTVRRETKSWKWALLQFGWMTGVALDRRLRRLPWTAARRDLLR